MKRALTLMLAFLLLLGIAGCSEGEQQAPPAGEQENLVITDTFTNGLKWGNRFAAEQGDWIAMRGEHEGKVGLMLYNKNETAATFLLEGDVCNIALLGNKVYYQIAEEPSLYAYDIASKKKSEVLKDCGSYQVREGVLYYLPTAANGRLQRMELSNMLPSAVKTDYAVDDFWLTDHALYYRNDEYGFLQIREHGADQERLIYYGKGKTPEDVVAVDGAKIAFLVSAEESSVLCSYDPATNQVKEHLNLRLSHLALSDGYVVTVEGGAHIYAVDVAADKVYDWGTMQEHFYPQMMSDCVILYQGNQPVFQYYPKK
ncbi:MAG: DUF5050 domain-containing protein [Clostridia bacterium]|nr:DUF5050 domain-containing protein [Clostridia bacterium]